MDPAGRKSLRRTGVAAAASDDEQQIRRVSVTPEPPPTDPRCGACTAPSPAAASRRCPGAGRARRDESRDYAQPRACSRGPAWPRGDAGPRGVGGGTATVPHRGVAGPPRGPACLSSFPALLREWSGQREPWGAACWRGVCSPEALPLLCRGAWGAGWARVSRGAVTGVHVGPLNSRGP